MKRTHTILMLVAVALTVAAPAARAQNMVSLPRETLRSLRLINLEIPIVFPGGLENIRTTASVRVLPERMAPWPTDGWALSSPEAEGMDRNALISAFVYAITRDSKAVVVTRHGYIVGQWYAPGWSETRTQKGFSVAKSVTSAIVGMLLNEGVIRHVDQPVSDFIPAWRDATHGAVTVRHLLSMNSGLHWDFVSDYVVLPSQRNQNAYAVGQGMDVGPNQTWVYNNTAVQVLSQLIINATGKQPARVIHERLGAKLGIRNASWLTDAVGNTLTYQSVIASAQDFAKFGYLFLRQGEWDGEQLISREWVASSTQASQGLNPFYGYLWWLNTGGLAWPDAPPDAYAALGLNERKIYVIPSLDIVAVRLGDPAPAWSDNDFLGQLNRAVLPSILRVARPVPR